MREALFSQFSFHLLPSSDHLLPLQTISQRIQGIWYSLTWPVIKRILKADLAVTIVFSLLLVDPIRKQTEVSIVLAQVAVEFIHPAKSYGAVCEDIAFGAVMCTVSTAWSLLGIYIAVLVRDDNVNLGQTQPKASAVLACFLFVGAFCLNFLRAKVDQANLGGMLSATILVLSITAAVRNQTWESRVVLADYVPTMVGFAVSFIVCVTIWPENSTRLYVQQLIETLEKFDGIAGRQVAGFVHNNRRGHSVYPSQSTTEQPPVVHQTVEGLMTNLVDRKRVVRREASANVIAPRDVSEMTRIMKKMRVPLQGLALSRAIENNMRKERMRRSVAKRLRNFATSDCLDPIRHPDDTCYHSDHSFSSLETSSNTNPHWSDNDGDDDDDDDDHNVCESSSDQNHSDSATSVNNESTVSEQDSDSCSNANTDPHTHDDMDTNKNSNDPRQTGKGRSTIAEQQAASAPSRTPSQAHHVTISVPEHTGRHHWRKEYDDIMDSVQPHYRDLAQACSTAVRECIRRLERIQKIDRRFQGKPCFYRLFIRTRHLDTYDSKVDPSIALLTAIGNFDACRLRSLDQLFHHGYPRRILFMLLHFQFHLRNYAERVYTLTSFIYEMEQARTKRRLWLPHLSLSQWFRRKHLLDEIGIDPPHTVLDEYGVESGGGLQRTLSRRATAILLDEHPCGKFHTPSRGRLRHKKSKLAGDAEQKPRLDPAMMYHDPDVAYPSTRIQWAFFRCWGFLRKYLYTADTSYALRACVAVMLLTLPAFIEDSIDWYNDVRGQWAAVVALVWMGPSVGSNFFGLMVRTVGTFIGTLCSILIWEISRTNHAAMVILVFVINLPWWHLYLNGRVELRHRIAKTLGDTAALYSSFLALLLKNGQRDELVRMRSRKVFRQVASDIRTQEHKYLQILQTLENIVNLMIDMENSLEKIHEHWRISLVRATWKERKDAIASFLTALHLGANALSNKSPLPPYVLRPTRARRNLTNKARTIPNLIVERLADPEYTYYSAYLMSSEQLAVEIEFLISTIRDLVGPDSVSVWLDSKH
ncbi:hypothetical protein BX666DRAFT_2024151 [Dichotomocladium elegans]|nr:hypothetical protein BX666DRAFT_2024151 [Dichotomocladium elegans]